MEKGYKEVLLDGNSLSDASRVFEVPLGGELTFVALGLHDEDHVFFEMVYAPGLQYDPCQCPPSTVSPASIAAKAVLRWEGNVIALTKNQPVIVMRAPQMQPMRAVRVIAQPEDLVNFRLIMRYTDTANPVYYMDGINLDLHIDDEVIVGNSIEGA